MLIQIIRAYGGLEGRRIRRDTLFWAGPAKDRPDCVDPERVIAHQRGLALIGGGLAQICGEVDPEVYRKIPRRPVPRGAVLLDGMHGLGDNLYQRAVLREFAGAGDVWLVTSWPQLYSDMPLVHPVRPIGVRLRTQLKNAVRATGYEQKPGQAMRRRWHYVNRPGSILEALCASLGVNPDHLDMAGPPVPADKRIPTRPYVVVRPATLRTEWRADSRNPEPKYIAQAALEARQRGFLVVSVADLKPGAEWPLDPLPVADVTFHHGELGVMALLAMIAGAAGLIGGVGWLVPAALAYRRPMLLIYGGWGSHNGPARIFDARVDRSNIVEAIPDDFCQCGARDHSCNKTISNLEASLDDFFDQIPAC